MANRPALQPSASPEAASDLHVVPDADENAAPAPSDLHLKIDIARSQRTTRIGTEEPNLIHHSGVPAAGGDIGEQLFEALGCVLALHYAGWVLAATTSASISLSSTPTGLPR